MTWTAYANEAMGQQRSLQVTLQRNLHQTKGPVELFKRSWLPNANGIRSKSKCSQTQFSAKV